MTAVKKLFFQTLIYGLNTVGRFLNYLLVPLHTAVFSPDQYGIISELYAYVAFLVVLLTYGMETTYFRFANDQKYTENKVFSTILTSVFFTSLGFICWATFFSQNIANWLHYPNNSEFVVWLSIIVGVDAISAIPLVRLRRENKLWIFNAINFSNIIVNILLNLFFLAYCAPKYAAGESNWLIDLCYNPDWGVSYVFISNLIASLFKFFLSLLLTIKHTWSFDRILLQKALQYGLPLLLVGLAGMVNETLDRILLKNILLEDKGLLETEKIVGIYGACYKLSIIITLFVQAFRYAAEPFFFSEKSNAPERFVPVMNYFVLVCSFVLICVVLFIEQTKYFIPNPLYWEGLVIVPVLLYANIFLGIYFNLSAWYKLTDKTGLGAYISIFGALLTIGLNVLLIPSFTYVGAAWATFICYFSMMVISYVWGQKHFYVPYEIKKLLVFLALPIIFMGVQYLLKPYFADFGMIFVNLILILLFLTVVLKIQGLNISKIRMLFINLRS